jgi:hypothetical protein
VSEVAPTSSEATQEPAQQADTAPTLAPAQEANSQVTSAPTAEASASVAPPESVSLAPPSEASAPVVDMSIPALLLRAVLALEALEPHVRELRRLVPPSAPKLRD